MGVPERIYLVEDDEQVRDLTKRLLEDAGHIIVGEASNVATGIAGIPSAKENKMTLMITDHHLGDGTGEEVVSELRKQSPETIIFELNGQRKVGYGDNFFPKTMVGFKELVDFATALPKK